MILEVNNLSKDFKNTKALRNINMEIKKGDIYGFIGENGAGKSTLIKIVTGVINQTSGNYQLSVSNRLGSLAAIIEDPAIHPNLNALNNLKYQSDLLNLNKTDKELTDLLKLVGLANEINSSKKARSFSLGMKQRLSIAMALISNPEFVLLDEPMNGLDPVGIKEIRELILKLNKERNITFLISSHILSELDRMANKYGFISKGTLLKEISAKDLHNEAKVFVKVIFTNEIDKNVLRLLNEYKIEQLDDKTIHIFDNIKQNDLMKLLVNNNIEISNIIEVSKTIEDYYMEIIGGYKNA